MTQGERVRILRKELSLSQEIFGKKLSVRKTAISKIERGENCLTDRMLKSICREFNVNDEWLRSGKGDMFLPIEDEVAEIVSRLLEDSNPFYDLILDIMQAFDKLDDNGKKFSVTLLKKELKREKIMISHGNM